MNSINAVERSLKLRFDELDFKEYNQFLIVFWAGLLWKYPKLKVKKAEEILQRYNDFGFVAEMIQKGLDKWKNIKK